VEFRAATKAIVTSVWLHLPLYNISQCAAAVESAHTLQRSEHKRVDKIKRIRSALASGDSLFSVYERGTILVCAQMLGLDGETKLREALSAVSEKGGEDPC
jgi:hypothetical protein